MSNEGQLSPFGSVPQACGQSSGSPQPHAPGPCDPARVAEIGANLAQVRAAIAQAAQACDRDPAEIQLLPVSKTHPAADLRAAWEAGVKDLGCFGENRVQEALAKFHALADLGARWTIIGHLQTNKARDLVTCASEFQALDSVRVAQGLDRRLQTAGRSLDIYVQVNSSAEASKSGLAPDEVMPFLREVSSYDCLHVRGLMTIAAHSSETDRVRQCFRLTRQLRDQARDEGIAGDGLLSMGMSGDLGIAIEEGSTCVRIGTAIFGARSYPVA